MNLKSRWWWLPIMRAILLKKKSRNSLNLDYPAGKLRWIFITDGSSDPTPEIISRYNQILLLHRPERRGKVAAMNRAIKYVETPYVIFSDANTLLNEGQCGKSCNIMRILKLAAWLERRKSYRKDLIKQRAPEKAFIGNMNPC